VGYKPKAKIISNHTPPILTRGYDKHEEDGDSRKELA
jgi:hypothetical protein